MALRGLVPDVLRTPILRLAGYDPARAAEIERSCTMTEIAEAILVRGHDNRPAESKK